MLEAGKSRVRNLPGSKGLLAFKADNLAAISERIA
jgi:hypothetical protein